MVRHRAPVRAPARRVVGAALLVAALALWVGAGSPRLTVTPFGEPPAAAAPAGGVPAEATPPAGVPPGASSTSQPDPDVARAAPRPASAPSFTTTAPSGSIEPGRAPVGLSIDRLGVQAPVEPVGVGAAGRLVVPASPMDVGWFRGGSVPGAEGVALLTSHVDTRTEGRGVLADLARLEDGDVVTTISADGATLRWRVSARSQHRKEELPEELFRRSGVPTLALVTCGGPFDPDARRYRDNVIVWAELLP